MDTVIVAREIVKRYGEAEVVAGVSFAVERGRCWGLLGPNGAGKTTLLRILLGKTPPSGGALEVLGQPVPAAASAARRGIGVVPQDDLLDPDFTVEENLRIYGAYFGLGRTALHRRVGELLVFASLETRASSRVADLSGGMRRRLSLARALVNEPALLVLDEPTTGLDPQARQLIWQRLRALRDRGMTLMLTTHYMEEAERLCDRVTVMDHGRFLDAGTPRELVARHIEPQVVELHSSDPVLHDGTDRAAGPGARREQVGDTRYYYLEDERALLERLRAHPEVVFLHRPANLEDVFLKLTGRELRDG